jgi:adenosylcobinamide-GDP ribazoletransferase
MIAALRTAIRTLTIVPLRGRDASDFTHSLFFFPLAGAIVALSVWPLFAARATLFDGHSLVLAVLCVGLVSFLTGGLHLDGLADCADAFGGGRGDKDRILSILKDPRIGSFGATALVLDLLLKVALYQSCVRVGDFIPIAVSLVLSRNLQALILSFFPYARGKEGTAHPFSGARRFRIFLVFEFVAISALFSFVEPLRMLAPIVVLAVALSALACLASSKKIGGITGDVVGAANEIFELVVLLCFAVFSQGSP